MKGSLSLKKSWYGLLFLVAAIPTLIMVGWGGSQYYHLLLEKSLQQEDAFRKLATEQVHQEITRLQTLLENKSDPMAYTLARERDKQLLEELLARVMEREAAVHLLMIIGSDGKLITGRESYYNYLTPLARLSELLKHWSYSPADLPEEVSRPLAGHKYVGPVIYHPEGSFFALSVPIGPAEKPLGVLLAHVDAAALWQGLQSRMLRRKDVTSYLVDGNGMLLARFDGGEITSVETRNLQGMPVVRAWLAEKPWRHDIIYNGLDGKPVFGSFFTIRELGLGVFTEIERDRLLAPIRKLLFKVSVGLALLLLLFFWFGVRLLRMVIEPLGAISADFRRVGEQDYRPSSLRPAFEELQALVDGFNHMVGEIEVNQQKLRQAAVVFDNTSEGILITDRDHRIVSVNKAFTEITGYTEEEVLGRNPSLLQSGQQDSAFYEAMWDSILSTGQWRGEIWNRRKNGEVYPELLSINTFCNDKGEVTHHIGVFSDISNIKEVERQLEYLAHHDPLTDLPNRLLCIARLEHALQVAKRNDEQVGVLFLDLDMFKNINDSMGHAKGDSLLQQVARRVRESIRDEDTFARLGGDEFVLIIGNIHSRQDVALIAENILALFFRPFLVDERDVFISASIGISLFPEDGEDPGMLLRNADAAMYRAKSQGRNNYQFYTVALTHRVRERLSIETHLRQALNRKELRLHYQPQYSLASRQITGVEALLRWEHPEMGMVTPDRFIPVAEETGLIVPIGEWVLKTACRQLKQWQEQGHPTMRMAVNLSARQFWKPGLAKVVEGCLQESGIAAQYLDLELTESIIMHDTDIVVETLADLHKAGVELSVDDFGTGYSSLSYLRRFPLDRLKIDRSFVRDIMSNPADAEMIVSIIALGHSMKLKVLAEGVETEEQLHYLREQGCDEVQGFYFSKPLPAEELDELFRQSRPEAGVGG